MLVRHKNMQLDVLVSPKVDDSLVIRANELLGDENDTSNNFKCKERTFLTKVFFKIQLLEKVDDGK